MQIVIVEPEIPQNTGNIARTCVLTGTKLHLVKPLGFSLEDKYMKRAGLDYWDKLDIKIWDSFADCFQAMQENKFYFATTRTERNYHQVSYPANSVFVFGSESKGLDSKLLALHESESIRIPMVKLGRSLNLSNAVAIILYEALRQHGFENIE